jgi:hypothetical protein
LYIETIRLVSIMCKWDEDGLPRAIRDRSTFMYEGSETLGRRPHLDGRPDSTNSTNCRGGADHRHSDPLAVD